jgi:ubiquitin-activating enzyme E1 C
MTAKTDVNGAATSSDWQDRYYHVDQILDRPGPRTDPSFLAGDEVSIPQSVDTTYL